MGRFESVPLSFPLPLPASVSSAIRPWTISDGGPYARRSPLLEGMDPRSFMSFSIRIV